jgi:hypothetical protein
MRAQASGASRAMRATRVGLLLIAGAAAIPSPGLAQTSTTYTQSEHVFNAAGRPSQAVSPSSTSFKISLESVGEALAGVTMAGASFRLGSGLDAAYAPPGEVVGLQVLDDLQTIVWSPEPASTTYNVYAGPLSSLPGGFGACAVARVATTSTVDPVLPGPGSGVFYLVTGTNRLWTEGTKGWTSGGAERTNSDPCP